MFDDTYVVFRVLVKLHLVDPTDTFALPFIVSVPRA